MTVSESPKFFKACRECCRARCLVLEGTTAIVTVMHCSDAARRKIDLSVADERDKLLRDLGLTGRCHRMGSRALEKLAQKVSGRLAAGVLKEAGDAGPT